MTRPMPAADPAAKAAGLTVGVLGGTGDQGRGLARRLGLAGNRVIIGSRDPARAMAAAATIGSPPQVIGASNEDAALGSDVVIAAIPWEGHRDLLAQLAGALDGKILIDCVNPLAFDSRGAYPIRVRGRQRRRAGRAGAPGQHGGRRVPPRIRGAPA